MWSSFNEFRFGDECLTGDIIGSVEGVVDADVGDEFDGFGNRTPSNNIPFTSNFTTSCGSPVDEFSNNKDQIVR